MRTQAFLKLVGEMLTAQQDYFSAKRKGLGVMTQQSALLKAKDLEKRVRVVLAEGTLEPDVPAAAVSTDQEQLDFLANQRPNDEHEKSLQE